MGAYGPIKDGLTHIAKELLSSDDDGDQKTTQAEDVAEALTSDEERELPGQTRPKRGAGWWGSGRPMRTHRKGLAGDLVDGSGLPSPGRWKVSDRNLPDDEVARELREVLRASLHGMESSMCGGTLRSALLDIMAGKLTSSPFPEAEVETLRTKLRQVLEKHGLGTGAKQEGDASQATDVRLVQALLTAFRDPDDCFCEWWAKGVWLGSPERPLPRAPAIYNRKTRWALKDDGSMLLSLIHI